MAKKKLLTTRSEAAQKLGQEALARMESKPPGRALTTGDLNNLKGQLRKNRNGNFLSTSMIHPEIRKALGQDPEGEPDV